MGGICPTVGGFMPWEGATGYDWMSPSMWYQCLVVLLAGLSAAVSIKEPFFYSHIVE